MTIRNFHAKGDLCIMMW